MNLLSLKNIKSKIDENQILKGLSLDIKYGEVHAIMGPNGSGKSTLSKVLAGYPGYEASEGSAELEIQFEMKNLLDLEAYERSREGLFLAFQYPTELPGVSNLEFLYQSFKSQCEHQGTSVMSESAFEAMAVAAMKKVDLNPSFLQRSVNEGFSGGEKKRNEIAQMILLKPRFAILDETDSGLDIDSLKLVASGINEFKSKNNAVLMITHYKRLLDFVKPDFIHVLIDGKIVKSGDISLADELEKKGYDWLKDS